MSAIRDSTVERRLCDDCEALRLDDKGCRGFIGRSRTGTPALKFKIKRGRFNYYLMGQHRTDSCPDFPKLAQSAAAGCDFCGFLYAAILQADIEALETQGQAFISLSYVWGPRCGIESEREGLHALIVEFQDASNVSIGALRFSIYTRDDDSTYLHGRVQDSLYLSQR
jgi:hypothetical protein